jgi:hypothetical protein
VPRKLSIGELRWPISQEFISIARRWKEDASAILLDFVWKGYDSLGNNVLSRIDCAQAEDQIERSITQYLTPKIRDAMTGYEPFHVEQGINEFETREPSPAQPPVYDIAFVLRQNERVIWPLEAKVLKTDGSVSKYVKEIRDNFLTCRYAPFSGEGAMLGYLLSGKPMEAFANIAKKTPCSLRENPDFPKRNHMISDHVRSIPRGKPYPANFVCHHLILMISVK